MIVVVLLYGYFDVDVVFFVVYIDWFGYYGGF